MLPVSDNDRIEKDSFGEVRVGASALWSAQTQRAVVNFQIGHLPMPAPLIRTLGLIRWAAAMTYGELGEFEPKLAAAIARLLDPMRLARGGTAQGDP